MESNSTLSYWPVFRKKKFHSNLEVSHSILCKFPKSYKEIFIRWGKHLSSPATLPSTVACQFIWFNKHIQIDNKSIYLYNFSNRNLNFVGQLFDTDGKLKPWECVKHQFLLKNNMQFQYRQIIHALPQHWKETIKPFAGNLNNLYIQDHHLIKCNTIYNLEKLNSKELYHMQLLLNMINPRVKVITRKILMIMFSTGNRYLAYPELLHLKQKFVFSSISSSIMYYILIKSYFISI